MPVHRRSESVRSEARGDLGDVPVRLPAHSLEILGREPISGRAGAVHDVRASFGKARDGRARERTNGCGRGRIGKD